MKKLLLLIVLIPCLAQAQDITEKWNRILSVQGVSGSQPMIKQIETITRSEVADEESIQTQLRISRGIFELFSQYEEHKSSFKARLLGYLDSVTSTNNIIPHGMNKDEFIKMQVSRFRRPWFRYFLTYVLKQTK